MPKYTITKDLLEATIETKGAELTKLLSNNVDFLHNANPLYWARTAPYLFPNVGALKNNQTIINEHPYHLLKHGFLRDEEFEVICLEQHQIILMAKSNLKTFSLYPFNFFIIIKYLIENDSLHCFIKIINKSNHDMPFNFGLHPAFKVPLIDNERFEDYYIEFNHPETCQVPSVDLSTGLINDEKIARTFKDLTTLPLNYEDYQNDAIIIDNLKSTSISLKSSKSRFGIEFTYKPFTILGIWTPNHLRANFIALEPWIGYADTVKSDGQFKSKKDLIWLKANETFEIYYRLRPLI